MRQVSPPGDDWVSGPSWKRCEACRRRVRMGEGFPEGRRGRQADPNARKTSRHSALAPEPVACATRRGPTPFHPEPGRETRQRRRYWRDARWESRSVRHIHRGVEQWQLVGLITRRSVVRIHPPLPTENLQHNSPTDCCAGGFEYLFAFASKLDIIVSCGLVAQW